METDKFEVTFSGSVAVIQNNRVIEYRDADMISRCGDTEKLAMSHVMRAICHYGRKEISECTYYQCKKIR